MAKQIIVVGGGLGGLSAAIRLRSVGYDVRLFEKNEQLGGKMNELADGEYRFDTGPSLLTMPEIVDDLFAFTDRQRADYVSFLPLDPLCRYFWGDGQVLDAVSDVDKMAAEMAQIATRDAENYRRYLAYAAKIHALTAEVFLHTPVHETRQLLNRRNLIRALNIHKIDPLRTMHGGIRRFFKHPQIIQLFDRFATYTGSDPFRAPATLNIIPYIEMVLGGYYISGGMYALVRALTLLATDIGVEIYTGIAVDKILHNNGQISGVQAGADRFVADYVVCNADVVHAHDQLIDGYDRHRKRLKKLEPSLSGLVFMWGVKQQHAQLRHHNIIFSDNYRREFRQIFGDHRAPDDPTIYIAITSKTDPGHAAPGGENWFVLLNMPYVAPGQDWRSETGRMRHTVLQKLRSMGMDISAKIETEQVITPADFLSRYASNGGSIYGISSNDRSSAFRRPANRSRQISGLYFAGGSTHPGGGIPLVLSSGKMVADLIVTHDRKSSARFVASQPSPATKIAPCVSINKTDKTGVELKQKMEEL